MVGGSWTFRGKLWSLVDDEGFLTSRLLKHDAASARWSFPGGELPHVPGVDVVSTRCLPVTRPEIASSAPADRPLNRPGPTSPAAGARRDLPPGRLVPILRESVPNHTGFTIPGLGFLGESSSFKVRERHRHVAENRERILGSLPGGGRRGLPDRFFACSASLPREGLGRTGL